MFKEMRKLLTFLFVGLTIAILGISLIQTNAQASPVSQSAAGKTNTALEGTRRNQLGYVLPPYPQVCARQECYDCKDFQYQEDAQAFFKAFANDPSGLDSPKGLKGNGQACTARPHRSSSPQKAK